MGRLIFYTGGARSGKSRMAERRAAEFQHVVYVATAQAYDDEMAERIAMHKFARPAHWTTLEEPLALNSVLEAALKQAPDAILLDCLTVWLSNCLLRDWQDWNPAREQNVLDDLQNATRLLQCTATVTSIVVSNEVGSGIVPDNKMARAFRDLAGRANQIMGASSDEVFLIAAGLSVKLK